MTYISSNINLFADDTSLHGIVDSPSNAASMLQDDVRKIIKWVETGLVNLSKSE